MIETEVRAVRIHSGTAPRIRRFDRAAYQVMLERPATASATAA